MAGTALPGEAALALSASQQIVAALAGVAGPAGSLADATPGTDGLAGVSATSEAAQNGKVTMSADGSREIVVKLDPEHLGSVSIRLKMSGEKVDVSITVDNPGTLDLLNQDRHLLTTAVSALGLGGPPILTQSASDGPSQIPGPTDSGSDRSASSDQEPQAFASGDPAGSGQNRRGNQRASGSGAVAGPETDGPVPVSPTRAEGLYV